MSSGRERRLIAHALARMQRRRAAVDWFWAWCRRRWDRQPHAGTRVHVKNGRHALPLYRSPRRHEWIFYEDCVHLAEEAYMLAHRLMTRQKRKR